jgi:hypothetical protein
LCVQKSRKKVEKNMELAANIFASGAGGGIFSIDDGGLGTIIDLVQKSCTCRRWDLSGIPCPHACAVCSSEEIDPLTLVNECYSVDMFKIAYGNFIMPYRDKTEWHKLNGTPIHPPFYVKKVGRPTKSRRKQPYEVAARGGGRKITRHGVIIHCGHCGEAGHNRKGCSLWKASLPPPNAEQGSAAPDAEQGSVAPNDEQGLAAPNDKHEEPIITQVCIYLK